MSEMVKMGTRLLEVFQWLYDWELNFEFTTFFDLGMRVRLGDATNGYTWDSNSGWYDGDELADALMAASGRWRCQYNE